MAEFAFLVGRALAKSRDARFVFVRSPEVRGAEYRMPHELAR